MSAPTVGRRSRGRTTRERVGGGSLRDPRRALALASASVLTAAYVGALYRITDVVGGTETLLALVAGAVVGAGLLARFLRPAVAFVLALALFVAGFAWYVLSVPNGLLLLNSFDSVLADTAALLTGLSVLRITAAGTWALGFAPAPVFLSWYFAVRRRYVPAVLVGGAALALFVLTGDAGVTLALLGAIGAFGAVGFGELERHGGRRAQGETLVVVLAAMVALPLVVSVVPGGAAGPLAPSGGGPATIEGSLLSADDRVPIQGSISLSPEVRFTVESDRGEYWRAGGYDRYTGGGWVRTGGSRPSPGLLGEPPGNTTSLRQVFEAEASVNLLLGAWRPTSVSGAAAEGARLTELGGLQPAEALSAGDRYTVTSAVPNASPDALRGAGRAYPERIEERYRQLPESTPNRVERRTDRLTANAENPYDTARVIERWLEANKNYSLDVTRPGGNIADAFLFEMDAGYCTYYATTMVAMLRSQGVPARFVTGYTSGQQVADDRWVVRGLDSHAWVEVYFPGTGWVTFDPTPAGPRRATERASVGDARGTNASNVDTGESADEPLTPTPVPGVDGSAGTETARGGQGDRAERLVEDTPAGANDTNGSAGVGPSTPREGAGNAAPGLDGGGAGGEGGGPLGLPRPSREQVALGVVLLVGLAAGARRSGATGRAARAVWLRLPARGSPTEDTERAFARLEYLLSRRFRPRRPGETPREYLAVLDAGERARRVGTLHERARYGAGVSRAEADEAVALVDALVRERTPLLGRLRRLGGAGPDSI
jgi:transglutaminase-like putative cysteine protease